MPVTKTIIRIKDMQEDSLYRRSNMREDVFSERGRNSRWSLVPNNEVFGGMIQSRDWGGHRGWVPNEFAKRCRKMKKAYRKPGKDWELHS